MTAMPQFKAETEVTTTDMARCGGHAVRVFGTFRCPHCLRAKLHASSMRDVGENEYEWVCGVCHRTALSISNL